MPAGMGEEERFAAAVEYGTTPASAGGRDDSANSLAHELEIVALLRSGGPALGPDPAARQRAKQRLMSAFSQEFGPGNGTFTDESTGPVQVLSPVALAERPVGYADAPAGAAPRPTVLADRAPLRAGRHSAPEPDDVPDDVADDEPEGNVRPLRRAAQRGGHRRAALVGAAAAAALVALAGTSTFASRDALPGDPMYGVKRVAESTSYALTFGEQAKARRHLEQAQRRLDEVEGIVARDRTTTASGSSSARAADPELVRDTMQEFDADTSAGSKLLLAGSGSKPDTADVDEVRTWASKQSERLSEIRSNLPAPDRADESLALLDSLLGQTQALQGATCDPTASTGSNAGSDDGSAAGSAASDVACGPAAASVTPTGTLDGSTPSDGPRTRASTTTRAGEDGADSDTGTDATTDDGTSARTSTRGETRSDDQRRRDGGSGGGSAGGSGDSGDAGDSGDIDVPLPLPVPKVGVPGVGGLPGVGLGGG